MSQINPDATAARAALGEAARLACAALHLVTTMEQEGAALSALQQDLIAQKALEDVELAKIALGGAKRTLMNGRMPVEAIAPRAPRVERAKVRHQQAPKSAMGPGVPSWEIFQAVGRQLSPGDDDLAISAATDALVMALQADHLNPGTLVEGMLGISSAELARRRSLCKVRALSPSKRGKSLVCRVLEGARHLHARKEGAA